MSVHTYPLYTVLGDYIRAALGIAVSTVPLFVITARPLITYLFWVLITIFTVYGLRTLARHYTRIETSNDGIAETGIIRRKITWAELSKLRLKYFSTRRDKSNGWMQLEMTGNGSRIAITSTISDFSDILAMATEAAHANGIELDKASLTNIASFSPRAMDGEAAV
ncbi:MAG: hypothetical protein H8E94_01670 [Alphaproteobacteria bacterium]|nr:hypothetical protein [Alphaproteobacteria bacterium]